MTKIKKRPERRKSYDREQIIGLDIYGKKTTEEIVSNSAGNKLLPAENNSIFSNEIIENQLNFKEIFELTTNEETNKFLIEKSTELYKLHSKTALELGKIFTEVEERLSGSNQYDGVYTKWLDRNGFNKMTALRYKRRYKLFDQLETVIGKNILMTLSQKMIDEISLKSDEEIKEYLTLLDKGKTKQELASKIEEKKDNKTDYISNRFLQFDFKKEYEKINETFNKISIEKLDENKKEKFSKDIQMIEKILKKYL